MRRLVADHPIGAFRVVGNAVAWATVKTHITHVLTKLNLRDHVHAVVLAYKSGLVQAGNDREE